MNATAIINGIRKYKEKLDNLSKQSNIHKIILYWDCVVSYVKYGCVINQYVDGLFYKRKSFERKTIVTYRVWKKILMFNSPDYIHYFKNKTDFNRFFCEYIGRRWIDVNNCSYDDYKAFLETHRRVFVKISNGWEGEGCRIIEMSQETLSEDYFKRLKGENSIVEEIVVQHPDMVFGNRAVNTIRVYTVYDSANKKAFCIKTVLRVGVGESIVDNSHSGGVTYQVDLKTGRIVSTGWRNGQFDRLIIHPHTDICMLGKEIPFYKDAIELCCNAAALIPQVRFVGWDVAITENGPILIEGNHDPDIDVMEFVGDYGYKQIIFKHLK